MNSFSINRFGKTLRWVVSVNYRKLLMWSIGVAMVVFAVEMILLKTDQNSSPYSMVYGFSVLCLLLLGLASLLLTSSIVSSINSLVVALYHLYQHRQHLPGCCRG